MLHQCISYTNKYDADKLCDPTEHVAMCTDKKFLFFPRLCMHTIIVLFGWYSRTRIPKSVHLNPENDYGHPFGLCPLQKDMQARLEA